MRLHWLAIGALAFLGCVSVRAPVPNPPTPFPEREGGEQSAPPSLSGKGLGSSEPDSLSLAAECLNRGDCANAAVHLECYVCRHPAQLMFRWQLAELLVRAGRDDAARIHIDRFIAEAQQSTGSPLKLLVSAHTRLMEIAQRQDDRSAETLHRGIGLLILAKEQEKLADADANFGEEMLCKAIKALTEAKEMNPGDPRSRVYLAEAYERSGNRRAAEAERAAANASLVPGMLSPTERRQVLLAGERR